MKYDFSKRVQLADRVKQIKKLHNLFLNLFGSTQRPPRSIAEVTINNKNYWTFELKTKKQKRDFDRLHMFLHNLSYDLKNDLGFWGKLELGEKDSFDDFMSDEEAIKELEKRAIRISQRVLSKGVLK